MSVNPVISIILPVYNAENSLVRCIDSVLAQTFSDFELLLVNDGSTDGSPEICDHYARQDDRVQVFHKENGGCGSARNVALAESRGEWVAFCDADDWVGGHWLQCFMDNINSSDFVVQGFNCRNWPSGETELGVVDYVGDKKNLVQQLYHSNILGFMWCKLFKAERIKELGLTYDEDFRHRGDEDFVMKYFGSIDTVSNVKQGHYHYDCPDWSGKYSSLLELDCCYSLFKSAIKIFPENYHEHSVVVDYFHLSTLLLLSKYKSGDQQRYPQLTKYMNLFSRELGRIKFNRVLFWPLHFILRKDNMLFSHRMLSAYACALGIAKKI